MKERILQLIQEEKLTNAEFAEKIGIKFICIFHYEGTDSTTYTRREVNKC